MTDTATKQVDRVYSRAEACEYLGIDVPMFRYHVYVKKHLKPDKKAGGSLLFSKATLDEFKRKYMAEGYNMQEAADYLGVELSLVRHHVFNTRLLTANRKNGRQAIFDQETLDAFRAVILGQRRLESQPQREQRREAQPA